MEIDYYSATVPAHASALKTRLEQTFGARFVQDKPVMGYQHAVRAFFPTNPDMEKAGRVVVLWGGHNPHPHIVGSGKGGINVAKICRGAYPEHRVSRADVCLDFDFEGSFDQLAASIKPIVAQHGVKARYIGPPDPPYAEGRTLYYGASSSIVQVRQYEKGKKELNATETEFPNASPGWTRVELQVRPHKAQKAWAASAPPEELWGLSRWSQRVAGEVLSAHVPFVPDASLRRSDVEAAFEHCLRQYGAVFAEVAAQKGMSWLVKRVADTVEQRTKGKRRH